jgi:hypothetical protein
MFCSVKTGPAACKQGHASSTAAFNICQAHALQPAYSVWTEKHKANTTFCRVYITGRVRESNSLTTGARVMHGRSTAVRTPQFCLRTAPGAPLAPHKASTWPIYVSLSSWRSAGPARAGPHQHRSKTLCIAPESKAGGRSSTKAQGLRVRYRQRQGRALHTFGTYFAACFMRNTAAMATLSSTPGMLPPHLHQASATRPTCAQKLKTATGRGAPAKTPGGPRGAHMHARLTKTP